MLSREEAAYFQINQDKVRQVRINWDEAADSLRKHLKTCEKRQIGTFCTKCAELYLNYDKAGDMVRDQEIAE